MEEAIFTLMMAYAQVVETSVTNNSPSQDSRSPRRSFSIKVCYSWVQTIFLIYYVSSGHHVQFLKEQRKITFLLLKSYCRFVLSSSPVPELSFLPTPYRSWTLVEPLYGAGRKESSGTGLALKRNKCIAHRSFITWFERKIVVHEKLAPEKQVRIIEKSG